VIRGWLGHADLATTNRYAEINTKTRLAAMQAAEPHCVPAGSGLTPNLAIRPILLDWLARCDHYVAHHRTAQPIITGDKARRPPLAT
jgi:hypothetical protein